MPRACRRASGMELEGTISRMAAVRRIAPFAAVVAAAVAFLVVPFGCRGAADDGQPAVARTLDGDTFELADGRRVRLLQIDTTELSSHECYSRKAANLLRRFLPAGTRVRLETDPGLDETDVYGRLLRYVFVGTTNLNLELVRRGAAAPYFFRSERGQYAAALLAAASEARARRLGLWGRCRIALEPDGPATATGPLPKGRLRSSRQSP